MVLLMVALSVLTTSCADDSAASVNGKKIAIDDVVEFSKNIQADLNANASAGASPAPAPTTKAGINADPARRALGVLFASALATEALSQWKVPIDEAAVEQQLSQAQGTPTLVEKRLARLSASENQLLQGLSEHWDTPLGQRFLTLKSRSTCIEGVAGAADQRDAIQAILDGGSSLTDPTAFATANASPLGPTANQLCFSSPAEIPTELQGPFTAPASTEIKTAEFESQQSGKVVVFFRTLGVSTSDIADPEFRASIVPSRSDTILLRTAAIDVLHATINPRFGTFDPSTGMAPPLSPNPAFSATATAAERAAAAASPAS